ncbi:MAG: VacJ family lipoprotein [Alphaproteobacteria bacterium]|nr:VacJ family lipoprotein [Alphaproteobacteria bacterium]MBU0863858.1 VacJ family lipoprotein [Alphaproteobacteria bacterium]MBU1826778.1 VacJ family lipoprotein [Alphaproteobacteria bacterium]
MSISAVAALLLLSEAPPVPTDAAPEIPTETTAQPYPGDVLPPKVVPTIGTTPSPAPVTPDPSPAPITPTPAPGSPNEIVVTARGDAPPGDPLQAVNIESYRAVQAIDQAFVGPIAMGYQGIVPEPVRDGVGNALRNLTEPVNFLNFLLQFKIGKAAETLGRFAINSTFGVGGLFDVAKKKPFNLPYRRNGFANTLGFYGVEPGPFFYLPVFGATTLRDMAGNGLDMLVLPTAIGKPFNRTAYAVPTTVVRALNDRIERDAEIERLQKQSLDPYVETRTLYLQMRQREIDALRGRIPDVIAAPPVEAPLESAAPQTDSLPDQEIPVVEAPADIETPPVGDPPPP